jgi:hypothetical protein
MPFDPTNLPADIKALISIRDRITPETWQRGGRPGTGRACILNHLADVAPDIITHNEAMMRLKDVLPFGFCSVSDFNDSSTTKINDIVDLLDRAIAS